MREDAYATVNFLIFLLTAPCALFCYIGMSPLKNGDGKLINIILFAASWYLPLAAAIFFIVALWHGADSIVSVIRGD